VQRVLVVEDEPLVSMLVADWLREIGVDPLGPAASVAAALDFVAAGTVDGAILDVRVGQERCEPVAEALSARGIPFALTSGSDARDLANRFSGAVFLPKPFDFAALEGTMRRVLAAR
jgi:DNA-binding response OmpR family regulator